MLVIDLRTVKQAAQGYVMLSRVQALSQLIILESVCENKLYASQVAMNELERMKSISINNEQSDKIVVSCNIRSLSAHFEDLISTPKLTLFRMTFQNNDSTSTARAKLRWINFLHQKALYGG